MRQVRCSFLTDGGLCFRPDGVSGDAFSGTIDDIQINLSTTAAAADSLSNTFADNVGTNDAVVYNRGSLSMSSADTGAGPRDFDVVVNFHTAFLYDPSAGNLLLDVRNYSGGTTTQFDAHNVTSDGVSRLWARDVNQLFGAGSDSYASLGLVTQFKYSAVPEPATMAVLGLGAAALIRRRKK